MSNDPNEMNALALLLMLGMLLWMMASLFLLKRMRLFKAETILGPARLGTDEHAVILPIIMLAGIGIAAVATVAVTGLVPHEAAWRGYLANAVFVGGAALVVVLANRLFRDKGLKRLGLTAQQAGTGVGGGAIGFFAVFPIVLVVGVVVTTVYTVMGWPSPQPHDVLKSLGLTKDLSSKVMLALMAVVLAPLAEEILFRGLLQTFLVRIFAGKTIDPTQPAPPGFEVVGVPSTGPIDDSPMARIEMTEAHAPRIRLVVARWAAVAVTALLFALVHGEPAFVPSLFVLAVGFGLAYEMTGNLWVPIVMHAMFNAFQIVLFLLGVAE